MFEKSFQISTADIHGLTPPAKPELKPRGAGNEGSRGTDIVDSMRPLSEANAAMRSIPRDDLIAFVRAVLQNPDVRDMHFGNLREQARFGSRELHDDAIRSYARLGLDSLQANQLGALVGDPENLRRFAQYASQAEPPAAEARSINGERQTFHGAIPPRPRTNPGYELGDVLTSMAARYGSERILPEAATRAVFQNAPAELLAQVSPDRLQVIAWSAMVTVDANAHLNPGWTDGGMREKLIRHFAENMLRQAIERDQVA